MRLDFVHPHLDLASDISESTMAMMGILGHGMSITALGVVGVDAGLASGSPGRRVGSRFLVTYVNGSIGCCRYVNHSTGSCGFWPLYIQVKSLRVEDAKIVPYTRFFASTLPGRKVVLAVAPSPALCVTSVTLMAR